jgi:hypothetical protein
MRLETQMAGGRRDHRGQIKTRDRVRSLAEVYTHEREVSAMLELIADMFPANTAGLDIKFLEPACGSGNFLEQILRRKLAAIRWTKIRSVAAYEHSLLRAVASIYGVDICAENVVESRDRMLDVLRSHYYSDANTIEPTDGFVWAAKTILSTNIVCADMLTGASTTEVIDYKAGPSGTFTRAWSFLDDSGSVDREPDLFSQEPQLKRDEIPVHYSELAKHPDPTRSARLGAAKGA